MGKASRRGAQLGPLLLVQTQNLRHVGVVVVALGIGVVGHFESNNPTISSSSQT